MKAANILGIDIAKLKCDVELLTGPERSLRLRASFLNNLKGFKALLRWLGKHGVGPELHVCLEATSRYGEAIAQFLFEQNYSVSMVNPLRIRRYMESRLVRTQNDTIDAALIADFCATQDDLPEWQPLGDGQRQLRDLMRARQTLVEQKEVFANQLETASEITRASFLRQLASLNKEIERIGKKVKELVAQKPELKAPIELLESIPGIGPVTAATVVAETPPINKIPKAGSLVAFAGLDPIFKESGTSVQTKPRLSRMGSRRLRRVLYMSAVAALRCNPEVRALSQRLKARGRSGKYVVVAAMRKLLRLIYGVLKKGRPFDPEYRNRLAHPADLVPATV